jgi:SMODS domain-containing protein
LELAGDFSAFLSSIQPGEDDVTAAKAAHEKVRERLRTDEESKEAHKDTFLSGSYARHTAINEINDVDVICILDLDHRITEPEVCLAWIQGILARYYKETKRQGRSVGTNAAKGVWLDIVPATPVSTDDGPLWIPDREAREWVQTHPKGQIAASLSKNKATNGYYVQVAKLLKFWRDRLGTDPCNPKSYILEALIHGTIGYPSSHAQAIVSVLEGINQTYGSYRNLDIVPVISDPGYTSVNVAKRWPSAEFKTFLTNVKNAATVARSAYDSKDEATSRKLWRQIFGSGFGQ